MEQLSPYPHAEFGSGWKDAKTFANVPHCPPLQVQLVNQVDGLRGKSGFESLLVVPGVSHVGRSSEIMQTFTFSVEPIFIDVLVLVVWSLENAVFLLVVDLEVLVPLHCVSLAIVYLFLQLFAVFTQTHVLLIG